MTGLSRQQLIGTDFSDYFTDSGKARAGYEQVFREGLVQNYELEIRHRDGHVTPVLYNAAVYRDEAGNVIGVFAAARDISERKRAEEALRESEERFRSLVENATVGIYRTTPDGHILMANPALVRMLGFDSFEELAARNLECEGFESSYPRSVFRERIEREGQVIGLEAAWIRHDGSVIFVRESAKAVRADAGRVLYYDGIIEDITTRRHAEEAVRRAGAYNRSLIEASLDPLVTIAPDGKITDANNTTEKVTGRSRQQLIGTDFSDYFTDSGKARAGYEQVFREGLVQDYELEIRHRDGHVTPVLYNASVYRDEAGDVIGVFAAARDITERKQAEGALRQSEQRFRRLSEATFEAIVIHDKGKILDANETFAKMFGYELSQVIGKNVLDFTAPESRHLVLKNILSLHGKPYEVVALRKDGSAFVEICAKSIPYGGRTVKVAAIRDITAHKRVEQELHESEERYRSLVEAAPDVIYTVSAEDGSLTSLNPAFETLTGWSRAEWLGKPFVGMVHPDDLPVAVERFQKALRGETHPPHELRVLCKSGEYLVGEFTSAAHVKDGKVVAQLGIARDITDRKRADEALRESEELYRSVVTSVAEGIMLQDRGGAIVACNRSAERILGLTTEELMGRTAADPRWQTIHEDGSPFPGENFPHMAALRTGKPQPNVYMGVHKSDGTLAWIIANSAPIFHAGDSAPYVVVTSFADITERKRAEEELYQSRQMLQSILDTIPQRVFWKDRNISYLGCNQAFAIDAGLKDPAEIIGKNDYELAWRETAELYRADDKLVMEHETPRLNFEEPQNRPDGSLLWLRSNKLPLRDREGKVIGVIGTYEDITERKQDEAERMRLMTAIEQAAESVVITGAEGEIQYVNPAFSAMTGYSREEALGKNPRILKSGKQDAAFYASLWATILAGQVWNGEMINRRKDGSLYTEKMSITPVHNEHGKMTHIIAMKEDITARKLLEDQFRQAQKMEAVGRLAAGVAHDFNNLLTIIIGYSDVMLDRFASGDPMRAYTTEIKGAGGRAVGLTRQLLAFSRQQVLAPQVLDLNTLITNLTKLLNRLIGEDIDLVFNAGPLPATVKADPGHIEQVLMNLAVNSRDAMPRGGKLTIETSHVQVDEAYGSTHYSMPAGSYVMLAVSDTGCGMDKDIQAHIFEPFFTTKEMGKGTGLGLATVYGIVKQSGGSIWVYSEPGAGTTFKIYLPAVKGAPHAAKESAVPAGGSETVLLVEDDAGLRGLARMVLEAQGGYKVLESPGGKEARLFAGQHKGPIHLLLTDVVMPGMSGRELSEELATLRPEMKILYMSGYTDDTVVRHGVLEEGMAFLQKPFTAESLLRKVRELLDTRPQG